MANTDAYTYKAADNYRMEASKLMLAPDDGTYNIIKIPMYALITDAWIQIVTAFTVNATVEVGWLGNGETAVTNGLITNDIANPTVAGLKRAFNTALTTFPGKYFSDAAGAVTVTVADVDGAVGDFRVFIQFTVIHA
jgi:hypothetical protein